jgi:MFS transporter, DHA1 family, multidrug resistance protein
MADWKKTFGAVFAGQICSITGFFFIWPLMPLYIKELNLRGGATMTPNEIVLWSGIATSAAALTMAVVQPIWGALADRYGRKPMVLRSMLAGAVILVLMAHARNVMDFVLLRMLQGALTGTVTASTALVSSITPQKHTGRAMGAMSAAVFVGAAVGPLIGGLLAEYVSFTASFATASCILLLGAWLVERFADEQFAPPTPEAEGRPASLRQVLAVTGFAAALVVLFQVRFANSVFRPVFALFLEDLHGRPDGARAWTGIVACSASVASALSAGLLFGWLVDRWGHKRALVHSTWMAGLLIVPLALSVYVWQLLVFRVLFGFVIAASMPAANVIIRRIFHEKHLGKAYGITASVTSLGWAVGPLVGGWVGAEIGLRAPFFLAAVLLVACAPIIHRYLVVPPEPAPDQ